MTKLIKITNPRIPDAPALRVVYCDSFRCRLRGFTFRRTIDKDEGILLVQSRESRVDSSIHMLAVFFDLAVFWLDESFTVVDKKLAKQWALAYVPRRPARYVLEIHPDLLDFFDIGDTVQVEDA